MKVLASAGRGHCKGDGWFLADQVAALLALCGDGGEPMLRATALLGPRVLDPHNAALRIVALFPLSDDKRRARALLPSTPPPLRLAAE